MLQEHELNKQNLFIKGFYIDPDICDRIVEELKSKPSLFKPEPKGFRNYSNAFLESLDMETQVPYVNALFKCLDMYKSIFPECYTDLELWCLRSGLKIQHYKPDNYYSDWHCENDGFADVIIRHVVFMTYLNDIEEGGGTEFKFQGVQVKPEKGLTLIWPADWTHMHRGVNAPSEDKFILTGWFVFNHSRPFVL